MLFKKQIHVNWKERWQSRSPQGGEWGHESHCGEGWGGGNRGLRYLSSTAAVDKEHGKAE